MIRRPRGLCRWLLRVFSIRGFCGSLINQAGDIVQFRLNDAAEVGALGKELMHFKRQAIDPREGIISAFRSNGAPEI